MKGKKILYTALAIGLSAYLLFLAKKVFIDKGYASDEQAKEILLGQYVIMLGLPNTKENRDKYRSMTVEQLKKELQINSIIVE